MNLSKIIMISAFFLWQTSAGSTGSVSISTQTGYVGGSLPLICQVFPESGANINSIEFFNGNNEEGLLVWPEGCNITGGPPTYNKDRFNSRCNSSSNTYILEIQNLQRSDDGQYWSCRAHFTKVEATNKSSPVCIMVIDNPTDTFNENWLFLLFLLFLLFPIAFIIGYVIYYKKQVNATQLTTSLLKSA